jgi:hypothetical protein
VRQHAWWREHERTHSESPSNIPGSTSGSSSGTFGGELRASTNCWLVRSTDCLPATAAASTLAGMLSNNSAHAFTCRCASLARATSALPSSSLVPPTAETADGSLAAAVPCPPSTPPPPPPLAAAVAAAAASASVVAAAVASAHRAMPSLSSPRSAAIGSSAASRETLPIPSRTASCRSVLLLSMMVLADVMIPFAIDCASESVSTVSSPATAHFSSTASSVLPHTSSNRWASAAVSGLHATAQYRLKQVTAAVPTESIRRTSSSSGMDPKYPKLVSRNVGSANEFV